MKNLLFLPMLMFLSMATAQNLEGSWLLVEVDHQPVNDLETVRIYMDNYFAQGTKEAGTDKFISAAGGEYTLDELYTETYDFNTEDITTLGETRQYEPVEIQKNLLNLTAEDGTTYTWRKISDDTNDLSGNWVITGRQRDGELNRSTPGARRTIKILGGDRFQWVAFNSETGDFPGTGGGTYTAEDGKYTENIEFFSRDDSRVGARLDFDYKVKDGEWHHSGKSSKGDPIYEIWSPYAEAYKE
ncbi:hypothetical protein OQ279_11435 [Salinimicrobium sp. MT39]|uniref:Membrane or secreted protein n=1 Tax=Salinimicrobium profundisediminis TaxID=2994553 RepID=A0A9X3I1M7_9FLAO|nr:hypothetical protein [Salinimicrobium profundisediminis]MCX2838759.1 hypothetical protein [Salinimicrobium profundisediminis]